MTIYILFTHQTHQHKSLAGYLYATERAQKSRFNVLTILVLGCGTYTSRTLVNDRLNRATQRAQLTSSANKTRHIKWVWPLSFSDFFFKASAFSIKTKSALQSATLKLTIVETKLSLTVCKRPLDVGCVAVSLSRPTNQLFWPRKTKPTTEKMHARVLATQQRLDVLCMSVLQQQQHQKPCFESKTLRKAQKLDA